MPILKIFLEKKILVNISSKSQKDFDVFIDHFPFLQYARENCINSGKAKKKKINILKGR